VCFGAGWGLRFQPSPDAIARRRGAAGERRTARLLEPLERHGWVVLHDLSVPGSRANLDHLVIGPGGVFVIDSKQYVGVLQLDWAGRCWHAGYPLAPALSAVSFEADRAAQVLPDPGVAVVPIVAVHGVQVPWGKVVNDGGPVGSAPTLAGLRRVRTLRTCDTTPTPHTHTVQGPQMVRPTPSPSSPSLPSRMPAGGGGGGRPS